MRRLATKILTEKKRAELEALYLEHKWYVVRLAKYISSLCNVPCEDLEQEGFLGFTRAFELYKPELAAFLTYAQYWIKMAMFSYAYRTSYAIEIPEDFHLYYSKYKRVIQESPELRDNLRKVAKIIGISKSRLERIVTSVRGLKYQISIENVDQKKQTDVEAIDNIGETERRGKLLLVASDALTSEEYFVVNHIFGLECDTQKTLGWVGVSLGVSKERVRQIKTRALEKIKQKLEELGVSDDISL